MHRFPLIFGHYFKRAVKHPINLLVYICLPLALIALNTIGMVGLFEMQGSDLATNTDAVAMQTTFLAVMFMISFQFFSGELLLENMYNDLKEGSVRWRLLASPVPQRTFLSGIALSSWIYNIAQALVIFGVTAIAFDVRWGNPLVFVIVLLLVSVLSQLIAALITQLAPKRKTASVAINILCFGMMFLSGMLFVPLGDSAIATFLQQYGTPLALGYRAILYAGPVLDNMAQAWTNIGILAAITAVMAVVVFALGRRRRA